MSGKKKCAHPGCTCDAGEASDYCSNYCKAVAAKHEESHDCKCGHAACDIPHASAPK